MIVMMGIGGFFMFRKFLKQIPKADGKSEMDWQNYYIEETLHMWGNEEKELLEELVSPVPSLFRDVAKQTIAGKIGELALQKNKTKISRDLIIEGYIIGTPKRDHRFLRNKLEELNINVEQYENLFEISKDDYSKDWQKKYQNKYRCISYLVVDASFLLIDFSNCIYFTSIAILHVKIIPKPNRKKIPPVSPIEIFPPIMNLAIVRMMIRPNNI